MELDNNDQKNAKTHLDSALRIFSMGSPSLEYASTLDELANLYYKTGKLEDALQYKRKTLSIYSSLDRHKDNPHVLGVKKSIEKIEGEMKEQQKPKKEEAKDKL
jgi:hypothetical protein